MPLSIGATVFAMTDDEIKAECEVRFQCGHSHTQLVYDGRYTTLFRSMDSRREALVFKSGDERVFSRTKTRLNDRANGRVVYVWKEYK